MTAEFNTDLEKILLEKKIISQEQMELARTKHQDSGAPLEGVLVDLGFIDEQTLALPKSALEMGVDFVVLKEIEISREAIGKIPSKFASHYKVIPYALNQNELTVATSDPLDIHLMDELGVVVDCPIHTVLADAEDIAEAIRKYYGVGAETIDQMMDTVQPTRKLEEEIADIEDLDSEASISKFLNLILLEAYKERCTDIHIEPYEDELKIRYRIDGALFDAKVPPNIKHFKDSITSRIKILSNLNIAEKRLPQDGRFKVRVGEIDLDLRVSFLPTPYGESVVMRILNTTRLFSMEELGLAPEELKIMETMTTKPHGIVFVTGPTGSGKTTTLYSCLSQINTEERKIITIEDPIEYQLKGITQIQIHPSIGLTFAQGLRSMLRHDPDVMMVGEVRDIETADIAIQVALTGHLIFSTLHTNDAASGVTRLLDMGVDPFLITSTVECFIAQRLVRVLCPKCKVPIRDLDEIIKDFKADVKVPEGVTIYDSVGCEVCNDTGFTGRQPIFEILLMSEQIRGLIMQRETSTHIKDQAMNQGMSTLAESGWKKVIEGVTTIQEVIRVTQEE